MTTKTADNALAERLRKAIANSAEEIKRLRQQAAQLEAAAAKARRSSPAPKRKTPAVAPDLAELLASTPTRARTSCRCGHDLAVPTNPGTPQKSAWRCAGCGMFLSKDRVTAPAAHTPANLGYDDGHGLKKLHHDLDEILEDLGVAPILAKSSDAFSIKYETAGEALAKALAAQDALIAARGERIDALVTDRARAAAAAAQSRVGQRVATVH